MEVEEREGQGGKVGLDRKRRWRRRGEGKGWREEAEGDAKEESEERKM